MLFARYSIQPSVLNSAIYRYEVSVCEDACMKKPVSHVVITHQYPLDAPGGGTRSCLQIIQHLQQLGIEVTAVQVSPVTSSNVKLVTGSIITVKPNQQHHLLTGLSVAKAIKTLITKRQPDAVLSWGYEAAFLPKLLQREEIVFGMIAAMPSYRECFERTTDLKWMKRLTDEWFRWRPFKLADVVYVSSNFTREELIDLFAIDEKGISVTGRGIDKRFHRIEHADTSKVSNFIFYGSLEPVKGVFDAIEALGMVAERGHSNWTLKIAGWGDTSSLIEAIKTQGISENVVLLGRLEPDELAKELAWAHLAILPSRAESFGRSIAEAQAARLAVISYDIGSIPEVVESGVTGWLVPAGCTDRLADAIIEAIRHPGSTFSMGTTGHERVIRKFTWERTAETIVKGIEAARR